MKEKNKNTTNATKETVTKALPVKQEASKNRAFEDFKNSLLIVSVFVNAFVFTGWVALQLTDRYNGQVTAFLFG